jgi:hypothetical protein
VTSGGLGWGGEGPFRSLAAVKLCDASAVNKTARTIMIGNDIASMPATGRVPNRFRE